MKYLDYKVVSRNDKNVTIQIVLQTYRNKKFGRSAFWPKASDYTKLKLASGSHPEFAVVSAFTVKDKFSLKVVWVRGNNPSKNLDKIEMPIEVFICFKKLVTEYNVWQHMRERDS